jgi:RNA polymerase sigma factor (sigma-70 family)
VVIMTGHGDVDSAREAFRAMAVDFLEKPLDGTRLLAAIAEAFERQRQAADAAASRSQIQRRLDGLTPREREVMARVVAGRHNREIAAELAISPRTVEVHKARMMDKLGVASVAELVRLSLG